MRVTDINALLKGTKTLYYQKCYNTLDMWPQMNRNKLEIACIFYDILIVFLPRLTHPSFYSLTLPLGNKCY